MYIPDGHLKIPHQWPRVYEVLFMDGSIGNVALHVNEIFATKSQCVTLLIANCTGIFVEVGVLFASEESHVQVMRL